MKNIILILLLIGSIGILGSATYQDSATKNQYSQDQITKMLKNFYTSLSVICSDPYLFSLDKIDSLTRSNCTGNYIKEIEKHEMLDYNPLIKGQDFGPDYLKSLTIRKDSEKDNLYYVSIIKPYSKIKVTIKLIIKKEKDIYKIDHVFLDGE